MSEFKVSRVAGQVVLPVVAKQQVVELSGSYMKRRTVTARITDVTGNYMRSARILDMSKPLHVAGVCGQVIVPVVVETTLTEIGVLVLQSQSDREIPDATGAFLQVRMP